MPAGTIVNEYAARDRWPGHVFYCYLWADGYGGLLPGRPPAEMHRACSRAGALYCIVVRWK